MLTSIATSSPSLTGFETSTVPIENSCSPLSIRKMSEVVVFAAVFSDEAADVGASIVSLEPSPSVSLASSLVFSSHAKKLSGTASTSE